MLTNVTEMLIPSQCGSSSILTLFNFTVFITCIVNLLQTWSIETEGNMRVMICLSQGGLLSLSVLSRTVLKLLFYKHLLFLIYLIAILPHVHLSECSLRLNCRHTNFEVKLAQIHAYLPRIRGVCTDPLTSDLSHCVSLTSNQNESNTNLY